MGLYRVLKIIAFVLGILGAVALANLLITGDEVVKQTGEGLNPFLNLAYVTFFLTIVLVLLFPDACTLVTLLKCAPSILF